MSKLGDVKLGDVVFCVDCDRAAARSASAVGADGNAAPAPPRRMAVKKDANGDRLCAQCLDARRTNRNAAFLLQERRAQFSSEEAGQPHSTEPPARPRILRIASAVRITRTPVAEPPATDTIAAPRPQRAARKVEPATRNGSAKLERGPERQPARRPERQPARKPERRPEPIAKSRARERAFVQLAAEIGFVRTRRLLDQLKQKLRATR
ncbi:MAG TPA: hypothetical protein VK509_05050 [Polyangiales bacterium]|nr:hypothetical protein [Polyangiales bacterium]